jgi:hypothetical protein
MTFSKLRIVRKLREFSEPKIRKQMLVVLSATLALAMMSAYTVQHAYAYSLLAVGTKDNLNQGHKKTGIGMTVKITLPQDLKTSADSQSVSFHVSSGIDDALNGGTQKGMVEVGWLVYQANPSQGAWFAEYFHSDSDCCPDHWEGSAGSAGTNGQSRFYKVESDPNFWWVWRYYQDNTVIATESGASGGLTYTTGTMPLRTWMELQSNNKTPVVGTDFYTTQFYLPQDRTLGYQVVTSNTAIYEQGTECPPYKSQGKHQNSALGAQEVKIGNNQGITTTCVASGGALFP